MLSEFRIKFFPQLNNFLAHHNVMLQFLSGSGVVGDEKHDFPHKFICHFFLSLIGVTIDQLVEEQLFRDTEEQEQLVLATQFGDTLYP